MTERTCSIDGCEESHHGMGFCRIHYQRDYHRRTAEARKASQKAYRADPANREKAAERARAWRAANRERALENCRRYSQENADNLREKRRQYRDANRDLIRALNNRRKALQRDVAVNDLTSTQWRQIIARWEGRCAYCGTTPAVITMDHVIPLSRGGNHTASNVVPACGPCNFRKNDGPAPPFINPPD